MTNATFEYEVVSGPMRAYGRVNLRGGYAVMRLDHGCRRVCSQTEHFGPDFSPQTPEDMREYYMKEVKDTDGRSMPFLSYLGGLYGMSEPVASASVN